MTLELIANGFEHFTGRTDNAFKMRDPQPFNDAAGNRQKSRAVQGTPDRLLHRLPLPDPEEKEKAVFVPMQDGPLIHARGLYSSGPFKVGFDDHESLILEVLHRVTLASHIPEPNSRK